MKSVKQNRRRSTRVVAEIQTPEPVAQLTEVPPTPPQPPPPPPPDEEPEPDKAAQGPVLVAPTAAQLRIQQLAAKMATTQTKRTPKVCACGCGGLTKGGDWRSGHNGIALGKALAELRTQVALAPTGTE